jgi:hypothetical protein
VSRSRRCLCFTDRGLATSQRAWALSAERWSLLVRMRADIEPLGQVNSGKRCRSVDCRYHAEDGLSLASRAQRLTAAPGCRRARHPIPGVARAAADGKAATHGLLARHDLLADPSATASTVDIYSPIRPALDIAPPTKDTNGLLPQYCLIFARRQAHRGTLSRGTFSDRARWELALSTPRELSPVPYASRHALSGLFEWRRVQR